MANFYKKFRSTGGMVQTLFDAPLNLATVHTTYPEPTEGSTTQLDLWQLLYWDNDGIISRAEFSDMQGVRITTAEIYQYFTGATVENKGKLCEFKIDGVEGVPVGGYATIAIMGFIDDYIFRWQLYKRIYGAQGQLISSTEFSSIEPVNMSEQISIKIVAGYFTRGSYQYYGIGIFTLMYEGHETQAGIFYATTDNFLSIIGGTPDGDTTSPEYGNVSEPAGGYNDFPDNPHGSFDDSSDTIGIDAKPSIGVTTAGFINVYKITQGQLSTLGEKLFPHFLPAEILADPSQLTTPETLVMMIKTLYGAMISPAGTVVQLADNLGVIDVLMNGKLIDYVLDCHIIPTSISDSTIEGLKVGYRQFNDIQLARATEDYVDVDCGSLSIPEYWGNFLDYGGCTVSLYLPFVGYVPIDNEYWNGGTISVKYRFNIVDGSFQAYVLATSSKSKLNASIIGQYGGVCCVHFPITGLQYSNVIAGLVNGTAGVVSKAGGGDYGGAVTNAMNMAMLRPDAPSSNGYNASSGFLSKRTPYLVIKRNKAQFSEIYPSERGLPLNVTCKLSTLKGFTTIDNPVLKINCSDTEYNELVSLLKNGVIF